MKHIKEMPHNNYQEWQHLLSEIQEIIPQELDPENTIRRLRGRICINSNGMTHAIAIYIVLHYLSEKMYERSRLMYLRRYASYREFREEYAVFRHTVTDENLIFVVGENEDIQDLRNYLNREKRLTAAEEEIKRTDSDMLTIVRDKNNFIVGNNRPLSPNMMYKILSIHNSVYKVETERKADFTTEFLTCLRNEDIEGINRSIQRAINHPIVKEMNYEKYKNIFQTKDNNLFATYQTKLDETVERMRQLETSYNNLLTIYDETNALYEEYQKKQKTIDYRKIVKFIEDCPYIESFKPYDSDGIELHYFAPILCYDEYLAEKKKFGTTEIRQKMLDIFARHGNEYELWTDAIIYLYPKRDEIGQLKHRNCIAMGRMGHPHIEYYGCKGNHIGYITKTLKEGDYEATINQISEMILEMNFKDAIVVENILKVMEANQDKRIWKRKSNKEFMTTEEVLEEIKNGETETDDQGTV